MSEKVVVADLDGVKDFLREIKSDSEALLKYWRADARGTDLAAASLRDARALAEKIVNSIESS